MSTKIPQTPQYPVHTIQISESDDGQVIALSDGRPIDIPDKTDPITAAMKDASERAANRPTGTIRVRATSADGQVFNMIVDGDGQSWDVDADAQEQATASSKRRHRKVLIGLVAGLAALALIGGTTYAGLRMTNGEPTAADPTAPAVEPVYAPPSEAPVIPPQGLSRRAEWTSPPLANTPDDGAPVLTLPDSTVALLDGKQPTVTAMRHRDGNKVWEHRLDSSPTSPPRLATVDGQQKVVVTTKKTLIIIDVEDTQKITTVDLPAGTKLLDSPGAPILWNERTRQAHILVDGAFSARVLPADTRPVWGTPDGAIIAIDDNGHWWRLTQPTTAPSPTDIQAPRPDARSMTVLGITDTYLLAMWHYNDKDDAKAGSSNIISAYDLSSDVRMTWRIDAQRDRLNTKDWHAIGTWAIIDNLSIDIKTGTITDLPEEWKTTRITARRAWSQGSQPPMTVDASGTVGTLDQQPGDRSGLPHAWADKKGIIIAGGSEKRLYALAPDSGPYAAIPAPTPTPVDSP